MNHLPRQRPLPNDSLLPKKPDPMILLFLSQVKRISYNYLRYNAYQLGQKLLYTYFWSTYNFMLMSRITIYTISKGRKKMKQKFILVSPTRDQGAWMGGRWVCQSSAITHRSRLLISHVRAGFFFPPPPLPGFFLKLNQDVYVNL